MKEQIELKCKKEFADKKEREGKFYASIGDNIKAIRKRLNITQDKLAASLNISRVSMTNIETGKQRLPVHLISFICYYLKCSIDQIVPLFIPEKNATQFKPTPTEDKGLEGVKEAAEEKVPETKDLAAAAWEGFNNRLGTDKDGSYFLGFYDGANFGQSQQGKGIPNLSEMDGQLVDKEVEISQLKALLSKVRNFTSSMVEWEDIEKQIDEAIKRGEG